MSVLVYTENWDGKFKKQTYELLSYASKLAEQLDTQVTAISIGNVAGDELEALGNYGAAKVKSVNTQNNTGLDNQQYSAIIADAATKDNSSVIILANNNSGKALAPRLSVKLKAGVGAGVSKLPLSLDPFTVFKRVYSGNAFARIVIKSEKKIITLAQNSFELSETGGKAVVESFEATNVPAPLTSVKETQKQEGKLLLTDAEIVVSGGRGMKSPDNWGAIEELAELLGGATACSRPVSDEGWRPHEEHTGQTGKIIAPNLYIAAGISGATQHIAGVSSSKYIVAINTDKDAPIFETAHYGIIGDAAKVLPELVVAVKASRNK